MKLAHFFHCYAIDGWKPIVEEHLDAVEASGLDKAIGTLQIGVVGSASRCREVVAYCKTRMHTHLTASATEGWEQVTLDALWFDSGFYDAVLYCHTKGVSDPKSWNDAWRQSMTNVLVRDWEQCIDLLDSHESVGSHWLTPAAFPALVTIPYWGGNMWWARSDLIGRLDPPKTNTRHDAEAWLGSADPPPTVFDMKPGWPGPENLYA